MFCKNCKLVEMYVESVDENNIATHKCKKCGAEEKQEVPKKKNKAE